MRTYALFWSLCKEDKLFFNSCRQVIPVRLCGANHGRNLNFYFYQGPPHFPETVRKIKTAELNPQPIQEAAPNNGDVGLTGPIVTAIIIVTDIAGIFEFMVKGAFETTSAKTSFSDDLNNHGVIYHACCESDPCCGMVNCRDLKEKCRGV